MKKQSGFTLIELAIVLVIIGLLLGGVLKGQELLVQGRIKNVIADLNGISAAVYGYQDRYHALPGDDIGAGRWAGAVAANAAVNGGNGQLTGTYNAVNAVPTNAQETNLFWDHLRRAGFVAGAGGLAPANAVGGLVGVQTGDNAGGTVLRTVAATAGTGFSGTIVCTTNLPDKIAIAVDTQLDDGIANTGQIRAQLQAAPNPALAVAAIDPATAGTATGYAETGSNQYTVCKSL